MTLEGYARIIIDKKDKEIEKLKQENNRLAQHIVELQKDKGNLIDELTKKADTNHSLVEQMAEQNVKIADLEKKLKESEHNKKTVVHLSECISDIQDKQLEQAKEIIRKLARIVQEATAFDLITDTAEILYQATLFMKEVK